MDSVIHLYYAIFIALYFISWPYLSIKFGLKRHSIKYFLHHCFLKHSTSETQGSEFPLHSPMYKSYTTDSELFFPPQKQSLLEKKRSLVKAVDSYFLSFCKHPSHSVFLFTSIKCSCQHNTETYFSCCLPF